MAEADKEPEVGDPPEPEPIKRRTSRRKTSRKKKSATTSSEDGNASTAAAASGSSASGADEAEDPSIPSLVDFCTHWGLGSKEGVIGELYRKTPTEVIENARAVKVSGFLGKFHDVVDEAMVQGIHGGGRFYLRIKTRDPDDGRWKIRASKTFEVAGDPNLTPLQKAREAKGEDVSLTGPVTKAGAPLSAAESKIHEMAITQQNEAFRSERDYSRELESKLRERASDLNELTNGQIQTITKMASDRADDLIRAKDQQMEQERAHHREMLRQKEEVIEDLRAKLADANARDPLDDLKRLREQGLLGDGGAAAQRLIERQTESHAAELSRLRQQHQDEMARVRESFDRERDSWRESKMREREVDQVSWQTRLDRADDQVKAARDEARRLEDQHRQRMADAEKSHSRRVEELREQLASVHTSKYETMVTSKDLRIESLQADLDRVRGELATEKAKNVESGDAVTQIMRAKDMLGTLGEIAGKPKAEVKSSFDKVLEAAPALAPMFEQIVRGMQAPEPPRMVVSGPPTAPPMAPRGALGAPMQAPPQEPMRRAVPRPTSGFEDLAEQQARQEAMEAREAMAQGAPPPPAATPAPSETPPPVPAADAQSSSGAPPPPADASGFQIPPEFAQQLIAAIDMAVNDGDSPEEFAAQLRQQVPEPIIGVLMSQMTATAFSQQMVSQYPGSAIASPAGKKFVRKVFELLGGRSE